MDYRNAAKALIVRDGTVLLIKRAADDVEKPDTWDVPGGRLELGEDPVEGIEREVREGVGMDIEVHDPVRAYAFTCQDGQRITMIVFWAEPRGEVTNTREARVHEWVPFERAKRALHPALAAAIDCYTENFGR